MRSMGASGMAAEVRTTASVGVRKRKKGRERAKERLLTPKHVAGG